jgi:hypothetical protein
MDVEEFRTHPGGVEINRLFVEFNIATKGRITTYQ